MNIDKKYISSLVSTHNYVDNHKSQLVNYLYINIYYFFCGYISIYPHVVIHTLKSIK